MTSASNPAPETRWETIEGGAEYGFLKIPGTGKISTTLYNTDDTGIKMYIDMFISEKPNERSGKGKELLRLAMTAATEKGAVLAYGHFISKAALGAFASVVGPENVSFSQRFSGQPVGITVDDAMQRPGDFIAQAPIPETDVNATAE